MNIRKIIKSSPFFPSILRVKNLYVKKYPVSYTKYKYKKFYGESLNINNPQKLSEKIQYLKLFDYPKNTKVIQAADKFLLHDYLGSKSLEKCATPFLDVFDSVKQINFKKLPNQFVLKKTNASGMNLIVKNKKKLDMPYTIKILNKWMKDDYGYSNAEAHYSGSKSRIICEPFLNLGDEYRFFMVSGKIGFFQIIKWDWSLNESGEVSLEDDILQGHKKHYRIHLDRNLNPLWSDELPKNKNIVLPSYWNELIKISEIIGKDFPVVRVDFNDIDGIPKITELTFTPASGFLDILKNEKELDEVLGKTLNLGDYFEKNY